MYKKLIIFLILISPFFVSKLYAQGTEITLELKNFKLLDENGETNTTTNFVVGDILLSKNIVNLPNFKDYDAVLTITEVSVGSGGNVGIAASSGNLAINNIVAINNPYVGFKLNFVKSGTVINKNSTITPQTIQDLTVILGDIDGNGTRVFYTDVVGFQTSLNPSVTAGSATTNAGFVGSGGPGSGYTYYRNATFVPSSSGAPNLSDSDQTAWLSLKYNSFTSSTFVFGVTGSYSTSIGQRAAFFRTSFSPNLDLCTTGCNDNTYVNAVDPNTIEYDNIIGLYHSTMAKEADGTIKIWGQGAAYNGTGTTGNILTPQVINSTNYPGLTGDILKFAGASRGNNQQFAVLTTTGMFVWGDTDILVPTGVKNSNIFGSIAVGTYGVAGTKADGLPAGVTPGDVKMMFGTERALSIVTCSGEAWMLSRQGYLYGDGTTDNSTNDIVWHRVSTAAGVPLTNVVAARGAYYGMMALTSNGEIYTWGRQTRLGNNTTPEDRLYATLMDKPNGITPKMIGMTFVYDNTTSTNELTYYLLATNGNLYSMGGNKSRQLGNGTTTASDSWINVTATDKGASLGGNIVWISPNEHDSNDGPAINVLTTNGKLWAWGDNSFGMLDGNSSNSSINPTYMPGSITGAYDKGKLNLTDKLIAVETGGHTTITIKECSTKFGYLGHRIHGSMADGTNETGVEHNYNFNNTSELSICGALTGPIVEDLKICFGQTANLADAVPGALPPGITIEWWTTIDKQPGTQVTNTSSVPAGTYYAFYVGANPVGIACPSVITIDNAACACYKPGLTTGGDVLDTKVGITSLSRAGADNPDNWPMIRKGGHIALESKEKAFVPNRVAFEDADSNPATPDVPVGIPAADFIEGMMMYDTTNQCLKVYTLKAGDTQMAWHCMTTQACPD